MGAAKSVDEKVAEALLGSSKIVRLVHRPQYFVFGNTPVECSDETSKAFVADDGMNFVLFHYRDD